MSWYFAAFKNAFDFRGRACRSEYWYFAGFNFVFLMMLGYIDFVSGAWDPDLAIGVLSSIYYIIIVIPGISLIVRRLHDLDRSGWWFFAFMIPIIGTIACIITMMLKGTPGVNDFGHDPIVSASLNNVRW